MVYAMVSNFKKLSINYYLFVFFFFVSEFLLLFYIENIIFYRLSLLFSFFSYLALINLAIRYVKKSDSYVPLGFTLLVLILNIFLISIILYILITAIDDLFLNIIIFFNASSSILLVITAVTYLSKSDKKKAYLYFFGVISIFLSDILIAVVEYYLDNFLLNQISRVLHFAGFVLIYLFAIQATTKSDSEKKSEYLT